MKDKELYHQLKIEDVVPILNEISIFGGLSEDQLTHVFGLLKGVSYAKGEYVFKRGDDPGHIYIVRSGKIKIVTGTDAEPLEIVEFGVGCCFGETSVIAIEPHSATAVVTEDAELIILSREVLFSIFNSDKELFGILILNIAREACRRLHKADKTLLHYVLKKENGK